MTERERLIELIRFAYGKGRANENVKQPEETISNYLLENGVIIPPFKVGDTVYYVSRNRIERLEIHNIKYSFRDREYYLCLENNDGSELTINYRHFIGYRLFLTKEEAEKALKARGRNERDFI